MDTTIKLHPGLAFSAEVFKRIDGPDYTFGASGQWQALCAFRGQHCPICQAYLGKIEERRESFDKLGVTVAAVSTDTETQRRVTIANSKAGFPILYGMDTSTMQRLGLYISEPVSARETDQRFPETALLVGNAERMLQIVAIVNAPFARPVLDLLLKGLGFVIEKHYPTRGTYR